MFAQAIRNSIKNKDPELMDVLSNAGLTGGIKPKKSVDFDDIEIVEDPNAIIVDEDFEIIEIEEKLPFFKSISRKLEKIYGSATPTIASIA